MKKIIIALLLVLTLGLSSCDQLFSEIEITFFNMKRLANVQMDIKVELEEEADPIEFTVLTDGFQQVTYKNDTIKYTYLNQNKDLYELVLIEDEYRSYKRNTLANHELDISIILELFLLAPEDFTLEDDGFYRPTVILYDFNNLEFTVVDGYISEMNFTLDLDEEIIPFTVLFSNMNKIEFTFPEYLQMTESEENQYFLEQEDYIFTFTELSYDITKETISFTYNVNEDYIIITSRSAILYYDPLLSLVKTDIEASSSQTLETYINSNPDSGLENTPVNLLNSFHFSYLEEHPQESREITEEDTTENEEPIDTDTQSNQ